MCNKLCLLVREQRLLTKVPVVNTVVNGRDVEKRVQEDSRLGNEEGLDLGKLSCLGTRSLSFLVPFFLRIWD